MRYRNGFPEYVTVAEKKAKAAKKLKELAKKNHNLKPVVLESNAIARTWWGKAWNKNLERYADYSNRIGRGRSYVRHGAVLDLQIGCGEVNALVQGSRSKPYSVCIKIKTLAEAIWCQIGEACGNKLDSIEELLAGRFPKDLGEIFTAQGKGMFPSPKEIQLACSCPDWATMCKHVAAVLYGIGARLDEDPKLFFTLRKVEMETLIARTVKVEAKKLKSKAGIKSRRVLEDSEISDVFGIEIDAEFISPNALAGNKKEAGQGRKKEAQKGVKVKPGTSKKVPAKESAAKGETTIKKKTSKKQEKP